MTELYAGYLLKGKYRMVKPLGQGGEGSVWLALHLQTEQLWAIKIIWKTRQGRERHELDMMKQLHHPSLPRIIDTAEEEDKVFLVMEYVHGRSLEMILREKGPFSPEQVLDVGVQIGNALCYLHGRKIPVLHLDIKPANIIRKKEGTLVLVDFGAARKATGSPGKEKNWGTAGFAAPEQYDPDGVLSEQTDLYELGAMLYYLLAGVCYVPDGEKDRIPGCPDRLADIIRTCLRQEPGRRYSSARQLCRALGKAGRRQRRRKKKRETGIALLLAAAAVLAAGKGVAEEFLRQGKKVWNYQELLREALCVGEAESFACYQKAVFMKPGKKEAYLQYLRQADADASFTLEEEEKMRLLLHTIPLGGSETYEEILARSPEQYGEVAAVLGMIYWYDYEGEGGEDIGTGWFMKAAAAGEETEGSPAWSVRASLFAHMGSYAARLGKEDENGERENSMRAYWEDLGELLKQDFAGYEYPVTVLRFYGEALERIAFGTVDLRKTGTAGKEMEERVMEILAKAGEIREKNRETQSEALEVEYREILNRGNTALEMIAHMEEYEQNRET